MNLNRRELLKLAGCAAVVPLFAKAAQPKKPTTFLASNVAKAYDGVKWSDRFPSVCIYADCQHRVRTMITPPRPPRRGSP